ncbi:MAG TPA: uroporphyrinogen-III synthase [Candidatus Sulfotelmatobacter sp.]|nr:uroporphyrinogen-III synthase [Candidatus Sulfotelmatobacter sp.]
MEDVIPEKSLELAGFRDRTVLSLESRRAAEIATLIENAGGRALVAPATREVPAAEKDDVSRFVTALLASNIDYVIFLTGVGTRALAKAAEAFCTREQLISSLQNLKVLARGPKPAAVLREFGLPITWNVPEPNTWREILHVLDENAVDLHGRLVAIQEHGVVSTDLLEGLVERGAEIMTVHTYDWALPEDLKPLKDAIYATIAGRVHIVLFTAAVQVHHLMQVADELNSRDALIATLRKVKVASIGPMTSQALSEYGIKPTMEPSHPKMGFLVREAAELP